MPFFIFAGSDMRKSAAKQPCADQLSTNDMLELVDSVLTYLGEKPS